VKPELCTFLLCDQVRVVRGKYNFEGIFFRLKALTYPCFHKCHLMVGWYGDEGDHVMDVKFLSPDGNKLLLRLPFHTFRLTGEKPYSNTVVRAELPLGGPGRYWFEILLDGKSRGYFPLFVETVPGGAKMPAQ